MSNNKAILGLEQYDNSISQDTQSHTIVERDPEVVDAMGQIISRPENRVTDPVSQPQEQVVVDAVSFEDVVALDKLILESPSKLNDILMGAILDDQVEAINFILKNYSHREQLELNYLVAAMKFADSNVQKLVFENLPDERLEIVANGLISIISKSYTETQKIVTNNLSPKLLQMFLEDGWATIITGLEDTSATLTQPEVVLAKIIFNNSGYISENISTNEVSDSFEGIIKGPVTVGPAISNGNDPIGYNMFIPSGEVKGVYVFSYGGHLKDKANEHAFKPNDIPPYQFELLSRGVAVVRLNLIDLRELEVFQEDMPRDIFERLHESIHTFCNKLKDPTSISPELECLEGKPLVLSGESFGGLMSIRHQQMYKDDFDRYISYEGNLSLKHDRESVLRGDDESLKESIQKVTEGWFAPKPSFEYLDPTGNKFGEKSVLMVQNLDDTNVYSSNAIDFFNKSIGSAAMNLLNVYFPSHGSEEHTLCGYNKGHSVKNTKEYLDILENFIISGSSETTHLTNLRILVADMFSSGAKYDATIEDHFNTLMYLEDQKLTKLFGNRVKARDFLEQNWSLYQNLYNGMVFSKETDIGVEYLDIDDIEDLDNVIKSSWDFLLTSLGVQKQEDRALINYDECTNQDVFRKVFLQNARNSNLYKIKETIVKAIKINPKLVELLGLDNISSPEYCAKFAVAKELFFEKLNRIDALKGSIPEYQSGGTDETVLHYKTMGEPIVDLSIIGALPVMNQEVFKT